MNLCTFYDYKSARDKTRFKPINYMTKGVKLTAAALLMATGAWAQAPADSLSLDNSDFTFTESQLDDDNDASQAVSTIVGAKSDPYNSEVGYLFSPMRFRVRGYDNMYNNYYINGLQLNDLELGRFGYSMIGGMNDATRNQEGVNAYDFNRFGVAGIGGATSVNARASQFAAGNKLTLLVVTATMWLAVCLHMLLACCPLDGLLLV